MKSQAYLRLTLLLALLTLSLASSEWIYLSGEDNVSLWSANDNLDTLVCAVGTDNPCPIFDDSKNLLGLSESTEINNQSAVCFLNKENYYLNFDNQLTTFYIQPQVDEISNQPISSNEMLEAASIETTCSDVLCISERTEYDIIENLVYINITDLEDKQDSLNLRITYTEGEITRKINHKDLLIKDSYEKDVYGVVNTTVGKCKVINQSTINGTTKDQCWIDEVKLECNWILPDKSCVVPEYVVTGTETKYHYVPLGGLTSSKLISDGKVKFTEGTIPLSKGGTTELLLKVQTPLKSNLDISELENKYDIDVWGAGSDHTCSSGACVDGVTVLDPTIVVSEWNHYLDVNITNPNTQALTNFQVDAQINLSIATSMNSTCADVRFVIQDEGSWNRSLYYWIDEKHGGCNPSGNTNFTINVTSLAASATTELRMYVNNTAAVNVSNATNTFRLWDDFNTDPVDSNIWNYYNSDYQTVSNGVFEIDVDNADYRSMKSDKEWGCNHTITIKAKYVLNNYEQMYVGFSNDSTQSGTRISEQDYCVYAYANQEYTDDETLREALNSVSYSYSTLNAKREDTWVEYTVNWSCTGTSASYIGLEDNFGNVVSNTNNAPNGSITMGADLSGRIHLGGGPISYDWVLVRKRADSVPTVTVGVLTATAGDSTPPSWDWNWTDINSTITTTTTDICINTSESANATLNFNGTKYSNTTQSTNICWHITGLGEGNNTINATIADTSGNEVNTTNQWLHVDTIVPTVSITSIGGDGAAAFSTSDNTPLVLATTSEPAQCRAGLTDVGFDALGPFFNGDDVIDCTGDGTTSHSCQFGARADSASQTFHVACMDTATNNNTNANNADATAEIDTAVPTQSAHNPAAASYIASTSQTVTFTTNEDSDCKWSLTDQSYGDMAGDCTGDDTTSQSCSITGMAEGAEVVYFACRDDTDASPNEDTVATNEHIAYTIDLTPPTLTWDWDNINSTITTNNTIINITGNENINCTLFIDDTPYANATVALTDTWWITNLVNGNYTINASCEDVASLETNSTNAWLNIEVDTIPPTITVDSVQNTTLTTTSHLFDIGLSENGNCTLILDSTPYSNATVGTDIKWQRTLNQGNHTINYTCEDTSSNEANSTTYWLFVDSITPSYNWNWTDINSTITNTYTTMCVNTSENSNGTLTLGGTKYSNTTQSTNICWHITGLAQGNITVNATIADVASNEVNTTNAWVFVDSIAPVCTVISTTPSNLNMSSTGTYEVIINCTDQAGINQTSFILTRTVEDEFPSDEDNHWSMRPPNNDKATNDTHFDNEHILLADGRVVGSMWWETEGIFTDNYTYAVSANTMPTGQNPYVTLTCNADNTTCQFNLSMPIESAVFPSTLYLSRGKMELELKKEYDVYRNNGLLLEFWDGQRAHGHLNYTTHLFMNVNYTGVPAGSMEFFYCNSSFDTTDGTSPINDVDNCVYLNSMTASNLDTRAYSSRNSSYVSDVFVVNNGVIGGITTTSKAYGYVYATTPSVKPFTVRYANGTSGTNVSFKNSKVAWTSTDNGDTFTQAEFTPDIWFSQVYNGSQVELGVYVKDLLSHAHTNLTIFNDTLGDVDYPITSPNIQAYAQGTLPWGTHTGENNDLNGTYRQNMTIHVYTAIDPDSPGTVNHTLYLINASNSSHIITIIQANFTSTDDSDVHIYFNTTTVSDGLYKMNITATSLQVPTDIKSILTCNNFTIDNTDPHIQITTPANNTNSSNFGLPITYTYSDTNVDSCWWTDDDGATNISITSCGDNVVGPWPSGTSNVTIYINDTAGNEASSNVYFNIDAVAPSWDWNWTDINSTITTTSTLICVNTSEISNGTLHFNGTDYTNTTLSQNICWQVSGLGETNYTIINASLVDPTSNDVQTTNAWLNVDSLAPTITWDWGNINSTTIVNNTIVNVTLSETGNCTLFVNGTSYVNATSATSIGWYLTNFADGNYTINATCEDPYGNSATSTNAWWEISSTVYNGTITEHSFNIPSTGYTGIVFTATWTATVTGNASTLNVNILPPTGCQWFSGSNSSNSPASGAYSGSAQFTCDLAIPNTFTTTFEMTNSSGTFSESITDTINLDVLHPGPGPSPTVYCGNGICSVDETCETCEVDCGACTSTNETQTTQTPSRKIVVDNTPTIWMFLIIIVIVLLVYRENEKEKKSTKIIKNQND